MRVGESGFDYGMTKKVLVRRPTGEFGAGGDFRTWGVGRVLGGGNFGSVGKFSDLRWDPEGGLHFGPSEPLWHEVCQSG